MSTLDIKKTKIVYFVLICFLILFDIVYERFSYGQYSNFMRFMFLVPLIGMLPYVSKIKSKISWLSHNLWNSTIAIFISGCLIKSIINISGRYSDYDYVYLILGIFFLILSITSIVRDNFKDEI